MNKKHDRNETVNNGINNNPSNKESEANMEDTRTLVEKIIDGDADLKDYDFPDEFDGSEIEELVRAGMVALKDLGESEAEEYIKNGTFTFDDFPFEEFTPPHQIWLLANDVISEEDFRKQADLKEYTENDWLELLEAKPSFADIAPWQELVKYGDANAWLEMLAEQPQFDTKADWQAILAKCSDACLFEALADSPSLYQNIPDKEALLEADSSFWAGLIAEHPEFAHDYPLADMDEVDEVGHILLHQPQLVWFFTWNQDNLPVKLFITNEQPENVPNNDIVMKHICDAAITEKLRPILADILHYSPLDARHFSRLFAYEAENFAGIYSTSEADDIIAKFNAAAKENGLALTIRKEDASFGITPGNEFEKAILDGDSKRAIQAFAEAFLEEYVEDEEHIEDNCHVRPDILATDGFLKCTPAAAALVMNFQRSDLVSTMNYMRLNGLTGSPIYAMLEDAKNDAGSDEDEKRLVKAICHGDSESVISMVTEEHIKTRLSIARLADAGIWDLSKEAIVTLLADGTTDVEKAKILYYLLTEVEIAETHVENYPYDEAVMHVNLMIHIMMGELSADDAELIEQDWYPFGETVDDGTESKYKLPYSYVCDPKHRYKPR